MKIIWTEKAAGELEQIDHFIRADKPDAATRVTNIIYDAIMHLPQFPFRGRLRADASFAYVLPTVPYIVLYEVIDDRIIILGIHHAAQSSR